MRALKSIFPILVLCVVAVFAFRHYAEIPVAVLNGLIFLPHFLALSAMGLAIHFSRSSVFFYVLVIICAYLSLKLGVAESALGYALLSGFVPVLIVVFSVLPERGVFNIKALPAFSVLLFIIVFSAFVVHTSHPWLTALMLPDWLPAKYFDWTSLSQSVLAISVTALISILVLFFLRPSPRSAAGLGILLMLFGFMHFGNNQKSLLVFCSSALLMCLYAILQESWRMAYLDELTGLPGRRALRERFQKLGETYTIAMLDVDHFKKFNDTYGHEVGDSVLRMIAGKLKAVTGGGSSFRYGGEEFTVVFPNRELPEAKEHLENLRETIAQSLFVVNRASRRSGDNASRPKKKKSATVTVSIGIAQYDEQVSSPWDILKKADKALYRAKKKGRNCTSR